MHYVLSFFLLSTTFVAVDLMHVYRKQKLFTSASSFNWLNESLLSGGNCEYISLVREVLKS